MSTKACPHCGHFKLYGPCLRVDTEGAEHDYVQCMWCQQLVLVEDLVEVPG